MDGLQFLVEISNKIATNAISPQQKLGCSATSMFDSDSALRALVLLLQVAKATPPG